MLKEVRCHECKRKLATHAATGPYFCMRCDPEPGELTKKYLKQIKEDALEANKAAAAA